ncbi:MAG TPA: 3-deoxy-manno-octulosonate cytidylyltransferase [Gammaproteobacteria bacterium]|nr:3-deoxy-manno-octulosonate cytidylyltransferase [Gammaproteobacteria bacterium]
MTPDFIVVIPARYASTRLPGKPLEDIAGKPMIEWVYRQARRSGASQVIVATDDERIAAACRRFAAPVELTSVEHPSGTDRIAELAHRFGWDDQQIVVNVQGDEPLLPPAVIAQTATLLAAHPEAAIATLMAPIQDEAEFRDPNFAKVVTDRDGWALYFSRAPIPWSRESTRVLAQRHIGLYADRAAGLKAITAAPPCALEQTEHLEQLRALWLGFRIIVAESVEPASPHVDTEEDLIKIRRYIQDYVQRRDPT